METQSKIQEVKETVEPFDIISKMVNEFPCTENAALYASRIYQKVSSNACGFADLQQNIMSYCAACLIIGIKFDKLHIDHTKVLEKYSIDEKLFTRHYKMILNLVLNRNVKYDDIYIFRWCKLLHLDDEILDSAKEILATLKTDDTLQGKLPSTLSAAAIYLATKGSKTFAEISKVSSLDSSTIRNAVKQIKSRGLIN